MNGKNGKQIELEKQLKKTLRLFKKFPIGEKLRYLKRKEIKIKSIEITRQQAISMMNEKEKIKSRETKTITAEEFANNLSGKLKLQWDSLSSYLEKNRKIRNQEAANVLPSKSKDIDVRKNSARGVLSKFVEWEILSAFGMIDQKEGETHIEYFCNLPGFYKPKEAEGLMSTDKKVIILQAFGAETLTLYELSQKVGMSEGLLREIMDVYVEGDIAVKKGKERYRLSKAMIQMGVSEESIQALSLFDAQKLLREKKEEAALKDLPETLEGCLDLMGEAREKIMIKSTPIKVDGDHLDISFIGNVRFGNFFIDDKFVKKAVHFLEGQIKPNIVVAGGSLIQGDFDGYQSDRKRENIPDAGLNRIRAQMEVYEKLIKRLEGAATDQVFCQLGIEEWNIALQRAIQVVADYSGITLSGLGTYAIEKVKRLYGDDVMNYLITQSEIVIPYMYRIGRDILKADKVAELIGDPHDEILMIIFILLFREFGKSIPEKYNKVVNLEALDGDLKDSKRKISPDNLLLQLPRQFNNRTVQIIANSSFSNITQLVDPIRTLEENLKDLQSQNVKVSDFVFDFNAEKFIATVLNGGTFVCGLPGCHNVESLGNHMINSAHSRILNSRSHRQITVRREITKPGIFNVEILDDGRIRFQYVNNRIFDIIEANQNQPELVEKLCYVSDIQIGSITAREEWFIKFLDYALYVWGATYLLINGDLIHGYHYPRFVAENRAICLTSVDAQKYFTREILRPFFPAPHLKYIDIVLGNHDADIWGADITGRNDLEFLQMFLEEVHRHTNVEVMNWSRMRHMGSPNFDGDPLNVPFGWRENIAGGFTFGAQHTWFPFGGGRTPLDKQRKWYKNMGKAARGMDVSFGGHNHIFYTGDFNQKLMFQCAGILGGSGYEFARGLMPHSIASLFTFSNKTGITVELIPMIWLEKYNCVSEYYASKNKDLSRPSPLNPNDRKYIHGESAPYIIDLKQHTNNKYRRVLTPGFSPQF
jgi:hypothetical protein